MNAPPQTSSLRSSIDPLPFSFSLRLVRYRLLAHRRLSVAVVVGVAREAAAEACVAVAGAAVGALADVLVHLRELSLDGDLLGVRVQDGRGLGVDPLGGDVRVVPC